MFRNRFLLALAAVVLTSHAAMAATLRTGTVTYLYVSHESNGFALLRVSGEQQGTPPPCATNNQLAFSLDVASGYAYLSVIQNALAQNRAIIIEGTDTCTISGTRESLKSIQIVP